MSRIFFLTDSGSDISPADEQALGIHIMPFPVTVDGKTFTSRVDFDNAGFYRILDAAGAIPTHSQITVYQYFEVFERALSGGFTDVINVTINAEGSGTYNSACLAKKLFEEAHPDERAFAIHNLDGASYTCAYGYAVTEGARRARDGKDVSEVLAFMEDWLRRSVIYFVPHTLKYAARSGRIPSAAAFVGELVGLKPIMRIADHEITTNDKVRGEKKVVPTVVRKLLSEMEPGAPYCVIYGCEDSDRDAMSAALTDALGYPPAECAQIGAVIAVNAGPRVTGAMSIRKN